MTGFHWTNHKEAKLKELWALNWSCARIAEAIGGTTRNAIIGKASRLHLPRHASKARKPRKPESLPRMTNRRVPPKPPAFKAERPAQPIGDAWLALEGTTPVPLEELGHDQCKWPIGVWPYRFCAAPTEAGKPYCEHHHRLWSVGKGTESERSAVRVAWAAGQDRVFGAAA